MRKQGTIARWNDEQGFGFIIPENGGNDVFVHATAFQDQSRRPVNGTLVSFTSMTTEDGRLRADDVSILGQSNQKVATRQHRRRKSFDGNLLFVAGFTTTLIALCYADALSWSIAYLYLIMSTVTFTAYVIDKTAAIRKTWRTPEKTLHLFGFLCGWPGSLIAQSVIRHKSSKTSFKRITWTIVILNCLVLFILIRSGSDSFLKNITDRVIPEYDASSHSETFEKTEDNHGILIIPNNE